MFVQSLLNYTQKVITIPMCGYRYVLDFKRSTYSKYHENYDKAAFLVAEETLKLWAKVGVCREDIDRERLSIISENAQHCVENLFKKGSPLSFAQQCEEVKRIVFADKTVLNAIIQSPNRHRSKSFALFRQCVRTHSPLFVASVAWLVERIRRMA